MLLLPLRAQLLIRKGSAALEAVLKHVRRVGRTLVVGGPRLAHAVLVVVSGFHLRHAQ